MAGEEKDLMQQVGETFNSQDAPQQEPEQPQEGDDGQEAPQEPSKQPPPPPEPDPDIQEGPPGHREPRELAGDKQLFPDKPRKGPRGELLDRDGRVIATTRREKQLAYNLNRAQYAANAASRENRHLRGQLQHFQQLDVVARSANLSPQELREAVELRALAARDPIMAVRDVVARVLASGVTMEQIFGNDAIPAINARVITNELDRRLGPMERQQQQARQQQRVQETAARDTEDFIENHPHADTHGVEISNLVQQHGLSPEKAYYELRSWVERRGFDFTQPLRPQLEVAMQRQQQQGGGRRRSTPGGRGVMPNGQLPTHSTASNRGDFRPNAPWKDIAQAVFTELNSK